MAGALQASELRGDLLGARAAVSRSMTRSLRREER
jgi:hypothetical protein